MKQKHVRAGLSLLLVGVMTLGMTACGNKDNEASSQPDASAGTAFNEREGYYVENVYEMPANTYAVVAPYMRPDGVVEFLGQKSVPGTSMTAEATTEGTEAATESPLESTAPAEASAQGDDGDAAAENPAETAQSPEPDAAESGENAPVDAGSGTADIDIPDPEIDLYEWDMTAKTWNMVEAAWLDELNTLVGNINAMSTLADGTRYVVASERQGGEAYDGNGYTPARLILYIVSPDGTIRTQDVDWHVANMDYGSMSTGMDPQVEVTRATFDRVVYNMPETSIDGQDGEESAMAGSEATAGTETEADAPESMAEGDAAPAEADEAPQQSPAEPEATDDQGETAASESTEEEEDDSFSYGGPSQTAPSVTNITVLDNGSMLISDYMATLMYDADGNYVDYLDSGSYGMTSQMALDGNNMYMIGSQNSAGGQTTSVTVSQYDLGSTNFSDPIASFPGPEGSANYYYNAQLAVEGSTLYWMDSTGIFSYDMSAGEAGTWTEIAGPELLYITDPDASLQGLQADGEGNFYTMLSSYGGGMSTSSFLAITYTTDAPIEITAEITVYTLSDDYSVRREVSKFRKKHPEVLIDIQTGMDYESSATKQDVINSLNKLLLAEKGPDMLILDGLPIESYIEKGVMMDLSEWMAPFLSQNIWMDGLARAYEDENGAIYALPTMMTVPVILGDQAALDGINSLSDFADYVAANDDIPAVYDTTPMGLLRNCYIMASDSILNDEGAIDEAGLVQFLNNVKKIADTDKGSPLSQELYNMLAQYSETEEFDYDFSYSMGSNGTVPYAYNDSAFAFEELYGTDNWRLLEAANEQRGDESGLSLLPANGRNLFEPRNIIGINARTANKDACLAFLESMTSPAGEDEVGSYFYGIPLVTENMMPIERTPEEIAALGGVEAMTSFGYGDEKGRMLMVEGEPTRADAEALISFLSPLDTPVSIDSEIVKAIYDNSRDFFAGSETAEVTAAKIIDATRIYMNE